MGTLCPNFGCYSSETATMPDNDNLDPESDRINKQINDQLRQDKKKRRNQIKLLLLGCGEAGKSTFIKQMKIIHSGEEDGGWSAEDKQQFRKEIMVNVIQCLQILLSEQRSWLEPSLRNTAARLLEFKPDDVKDHLKIWDIRDNILAIWEDPAIQETYNRRNEFNLPDCCRYFLSNIHRVSDPNFVPESKDILQVRVKTTGVIEYNFVNEEDGKEFIMIDVGGQRTERKKC